MPIKTILYLAVALSMVLSLLAVALSGASAAPQSQQASVSLLDSRMEPQNLTVTVGATVTWSNNGNLPHTVTSDTGAFGSGNLARGQSFSYTFGAPGTFPYSCDFHKAGGMVGTVVVQAAAQPTTPPPAPTPAPKPPAPTAAPPAAPAPTVAAPTATPAPAKVLATAGPKPGAAPAVPKAGDDLQAAGLGLLAGLLFLTGLAIRRVSVRR